MKTLGDLKANPENPRTISDEKLKTLKRTLIRFGDLSGIVENVRTGRVVGGHQRLKVLPPGCKFIVTHKFEKPTKTGTIAVGYFKVGGERYPFRQVVWDDATEKAANIAANQGGGEWELSGLKKWMKDLSSDGFDLSLTGFDEGELSSLIAATKEFEPGSEDDQGKLDRKKMATCPNCLHEFTPE